MSKSDDKKLAALAKKNAAKIATPKSRVRKKYDSTLPPEDEAAQDAHKFFSQMKKREF
jgi:hypothetical protein